MLNATAARYVIAEDASFESILDTAKIEMCKAVKSKCKVNVVGALYGDTKDCPIFPKKKGMDTDKIIIICMYCL